jgi:hypothetical protein
METTLIQRCVPSGNPVSLHDEIKTGTEREREIKRGGGGWSERARESKRRGQREGHREREKERDLQQVSPEVTPAAALLDQSWDAEVNGRSGKMYPTWHHIP